MMSMWLSYSNSSLSLNSSCVRFGPFISGHRFALTGSTSWSRSVAWFLVSMSAPYEVRALIRSDLRMQPGRWLCEKILNAFLTWSLTAHVSQSFDGFHTTPALRRVVVAQLTGHDGDELGELDAPVGILVNLLDHRVHCIGQAAVAFQRVEQVVWPVRRVPSSSVVSTPSMRSSSVNTSGVMNPACDLSTRLKISSSSAISISLRPRLALTASAAISPACLVRSTTMHTEQQPTTPGHTHTNAIYGLLLIHTFTDQLSGAFFL